MNILILNVQGMSCMGCVRNVQGRLSAVPGVKTVEVDLGSGRVIVTHDPAQADTTAIRQTILDAGFSLAD